MKHTFRKLDPGMQMASGSDPELKDVESQGHGKWDEVLSCTQHKIEVWCPKPPHCLGAAAFHQESHLLFPHLPTLGTLLQGPFSSVWRGRQYIMDPSQGYSTALASVL